MEKMALTNYKIIHLHMAVIGLAAVIDNHSGCDKKICNPKFFTSVKS